MKPCKDCPFSSEVGSYLSLEKRLDIDVTISNEARISVGGFERSEQRKTFEMRSGDAFLLFGSSRMRFHGLDKIFPGTAPPGLNLKQEGRISFVAQQRVFLNYA